MTDNLKELMDLTIKLQSALDNNYLQLFDTISEEQQFNLNLSLLQKNIIIQISKYCYENLYKETMLNCILDLAEDKVYKYIKDTIKRFPNNYTDLTNFNNLILSTLKEHLVVSDYEKFITQLEHKQFELLNHNE